LKKGGIMASGTGERSTGNGDLLQFCNSTDRLDDVVRHPRAPIGLAIFTSAYILAGGFGQGLSLIPGVSIIFWPPAGIFVATLLTAPRQTWPQWIAAGCVAELICNALWFHNSIPFALLYFAANALTALTAAWLVERFVPKPMRLDSLKEVAILTFMAAGIAPMASATVIAMIDAMIGKHPFATAWLLVWIGDGTGLLVSTPLTLVAIQAWRHRDKISRQRLLEAVLVCVLMVGIGFLALREQLPTIYLLMPMVLWMAARFVLPGVAVALPLVALMTASFTVLGSGEFSGSPEMMQAKIVALQVFLGVSAVSALLVAAVSTERQQAISKLNAVNAALERHVEERTAALQQSNAELHSSEERFRTIANYIYDWDSWIGLDGTLKWVNPAVERITGLTVDECLCMANYPIPLIHPDDRERMRAHFMDAQNGESGNDVPFRIERADGTVVWVAISWQPVTAVDGSLLGYRSSVRDISTRKQAEEALAASEARYRGLVNVMPTAVYTCDAAGCITFFNEHAAELWGRPPKHGESVDEFLGSFQLGLPDGQSLPYDKTPMVRAIREGISVRNQEVVIEHPGGKRLHLLVNIDPLRDEEGCISGAIKAFSDITQRKLQELALQVSEERLRDRNGQLALLARVSQILIVADQSESELLASVFSDVAEAIGAEMYFHYQPYDDVSMRLHSWKALSHAERAMFETMRYGEFLCGRVALGRQRIIVEDIAHSDVQGSEAFRAAGYGAYAGFPLVANNQLLGTIAFIAQTRKHFADGAVQMIQTVCDHVATTLDRLRLMRKLREGEQRIQQALRVSRSYTFEWEPKTDRVLRSKSCGEILQLAGEQAVSDTGHHYFHRIHSEDRVPFVALMSGLTPNSPSYSTEYRLTRSDGSVVTLEEIGQGSFDAHGELVRLVGVATDITERKQAEIALRLSQQRLELGTRVGGLALVDIDYAAGECHLTAEAARLFGFGDEACVLPRQVMHDTFHPDDRDALMDCIGACLDPAGDGWGALDHRVIRPSDGATVWLRARQQVFFEGEGEQRRPVRGILAVIDLTTERKAEAAVRQSEAFIRGVLDSLPEHVAVLDAHGVIISVNKRWQDFALNNGGGESALSPIGINYLELISRESTLEDEYAQAAFESLSGFISGEVDSVEMEYPCHAPDHPRWFLMSARRVINTGHVVISHLDITERKRIESWQAGQRCVLEMLGKGQPLGEVLAAVCRFIEEQQPGLLCSILLPDEHRQCIGQAFGPSLREAHIQALIGLGIGPPYIGACGEVLDCGSAVMVQDVPADTRFAPEWRALLEASGLKSCWSAPVLGLDGTVLAAFAVYSRNSDDLGRVNQELIDVAANLSGIAIQHVQAEQQLRRSEQFNRSLVDGSADCVMVLDTDGRLLLMNAPGLRMMEIDDFSMLGDREWWELWPEESRPVLQQAVKSALHGRLFSFEAFCPTAKGTPKWWEVTVSPVREDEGSPVIRVLSVSRDVTARRQAEDALRESNARLTKVLEVETAGVMFWDMSTQRLLDANDTFLQMMGYDRHELHTGELTRQKFTPPEQSVISQAELLKFAETGHVGPYEKEFIRKDGSRQWLLFAGSSLGDNQCVEFCIDISDRKKAEVALHRAHQRLETALEASQVALFHQDCDLRYTWIQNPALDFKAHDVVGKRDVDLFQLADDAILLETIKRRAIQTGRTQREEVCISQDGQLRYYDLVVQPDRDVHGDITGVNCAAVDITHRKNMENALRVNEERFRSLFESMDEGYCLVEMEFDDTGRAVDYRVIEMNPAFERHTGIQNLRGRSIREAIPDLEEHWFETYGRVARTGEPIRFLNQAGPLDGRWFDVYAFRLGGDGSKQVAVLFNNITQRKKNEEALKESDRRKDEFLATLSHELRNPLATIRSGLEAMKLAPDDQLAVEETCDLIQRQVTHLVALVDDLLEVSRISQGKLKLRRKVVSIADAIQSAIEITRPQIDEAGHSLSVESPQQTVYVKGDPHRLTQMFANLLNNAAKYTPYGGQISVIARLQEQDVVIEIHDTGIGISTEQLPRIFELFAQVKNESSIYAGLGIGLSLVRSLIELHGGSITAASEGEGAGSTFTIRLPVCHSVEEPRQIAPLASPTLKASKGRRILVVDDNEAAAKMLSIVIKMLGNEVLTAFNGQEAIEKGREFKPDIIFMDIGMPVMDGYAAAKAIRSEPWGRCPLLIALTGWGRDDDKKKTKDAGFDRHLVKPVEPDVIRKILTEQPAASFSGREVSNAPGS
jgi:PAS domain S-box-containing protein